jgi:hypothetical protein
MAARHLALVAVAVAAASCNTFVGPTPPDANWNVHDTARLSLYTRPGSFADANAAKIGEVLEDQYTYTLTVLDARFAARVSGFLYNSGADAGFEGDHSGTAYPDTRAFRAVAIPPLGDDLYSLINHEANHVLIQGALGTPGTSFVNEGLASALVSDHFGAIGRTFLHRWVRDHRAQIPPLADLTDDSRWRNINSQITYNASASFLVFLLDTYGAQRLKAIYGVPSGALSDRTRSVYGKSLEDLEAEWQRFYTAIGG